MFFVLLERLALQQQRFRFCLIKCTFSFNQTTTWFLFQKNCIVKLREFFVSASKNNPDISPKYTTPSRDPIQIPSIVFSGFSGSNLQDGLLPSPRVNRTTALPVCDSFGSEDVKPLEVGENARFFLKKISKDGLPLEV